jgi:enterobacterial common antigen flippase
LSGSSYRVALRTTSITGASQIVVLLLKLVKSKVIAVLLGPSGIGLFGLLTTVLSIVTTLANLGMSGSAVRQVADASASGDGTRLARVVWTIRRLTLLLGIVAAAVLALAAGPVSEVSVGTRELETPLRVLSLAALFGLVTMGQSAVLRGLRRIGDLARLSVWGALWGTALAIPFVWWLGLRGVAPAMVIAAALALLASWWYSRRVAIEPVALRLREMTQEVRGLLQLGMAFLVTGLLAAVVQYVLRIILVREGGLGMAGEFQAAATLSIVYVTFILQAMSQDFYPRLTGVAQDDAAVNRMVNEQAELSLLLAGPGLVATVAVAPWLVQLLYSDQFVAAADVLRWQCLGVLLRVVSWPIGFVLLARGEGLTYAITEVIGHAVHVAAFWLLATSGGLQGAAFALGIFYALYLPAIYVIVRRMTGFAWTPPVARLLALALGTLLAALLVTRLVGNLPGAVIGALMAAVLAVWGYRRLVTLTNIPLAQWLVAKLPGLRPARRR